VTSEAGRPGRLTDVKRIDWRRKAGRRLGSSEYGEEVEGPMGLLRNTLVTILSQWAGYCLEGVTSVIVARSLGPTGKGALAVLNVLSGLAVQMGNFGLHAATTYFAARDAGALPRIAWVSLFLAPAIGAILALGMGGLLALVPSLVPHVPSFLLAVTLFGLPFAFLILFFRNILLGLQRITAYNLLDVGGKLLVLPIALYILFALGGGVRELIVAGLCMTILTSVAAVSLTFRGLRSHFCFDCRLLKRMLTYGSRSYVSCLLAFLIIRSDMLLVNYFLGPAEAGLYAVAVNLSDLLLVFPGAVGAMLFPRVSAQQADDGTLTAAVCRHTAAGMVLLCAGVGVLARPLVLLLYGTAFVGAVTPFLLLLPGILALSLEMIFMNDLAGRGLPPVVITVPGMGLVVNLILNLFLLPRFGLLAAAASSSIAYGVMLAVAWGAFSRRTTVAATACSLLTLADARALWGRLARWRRSGGLSRDASR
jgi:O-antigen/teichoic acid export membrane protein